MRSLHYDVIKLSILISDGFYYYMFMSYLRKIYENIYFYLIDLFACLFVVFIYK